MHIFDLKKKKPTLLPARRGPTFGPRFIDDPSRDPVRQTQQQSAKREPGHLPGATCLAARRDVLTAWTQASEGPDQKPDPAETHGGRRGERERRLSGLVATQTLRFELGSRSPAVNMAAAVPRRVHSSSSRRPASPVCVMNKKQGCSSLLFVNGGCLMYPGIMTS